jgi:uncharacterized protein (DUF697 family)
MSQGQEAHSQRAPIRGLRNPVKLTKAAFEAEKMGGPLIDRFAGALVRAFNESDLTFRDIDRVILTGGSARWYFVRQATDSYFSRDVCLISANPELTISQGLALARTGFTMPTRTALPVEVSTAINAGQPVLPVDIDTIPINSVAAGPLDLKRCRQKAEGIIQKRALAGGAVGLLLSPIPGVSQVPLTAIETEMVMKVGEAYGYKLTEKQLVTVVGGLLAGGTVAKVAVMETLTFVPGVGWILKGGVAGGAAYGFGRLAIEYFERRRRIEQGGGS